MAWPTDVTPPIATPIGIHGSIQLGPAAISLAEYDASGGEFNITQAFVEKPSTRWALVRSEPGQRRATIRIDLNVDAEDPPDFKSGDVVYFEFSVLGRYTYAGHFIVGDTPDSFAADGDAPYSISGPVQAFTRTANPVTPPA